MLRAECCAVFSAFEHARVYATERKQGSARASESARAGERARERERRGARVQGHLGGLGAGMRFRTTERPSFLFACSARSACAPALPVVRSACNARSACSARSVCSARSACAPALPGRPLCLGALLRPPCDATCCAPRACRPSSRSSARNAERASAAMIRMAATRETRPRPSWLSLPWPRSCAAWRRRRSALPAMATAMAIRRRPPRSRWSPQRRPTLPRPLSSPPSPWRPLRVALLCRKSASFDSAHIRTRSRTTTSTSTTAPGMPGGGRGTALTQPRALQAALLPSPIRDGVHSRPCVSPVSPEQMNWSRYYPAYFAPDGTPTGPTRRQVEFADVGCGYGGLLGAAMGAFPAMRAFLAIPDHAHSRARRPCVRAVHS